MAEPALVVRGPAKRGDDFVEAARGLVVATMLAALAGMVDVIGYLHLKGLFVSFMSGNSTQLAAALGRGDLGGAATIARTGRAVRTRGRRRPNAGRFHREMAHNLCADRSRAVPRNRGGAGDNPRPDGLRNGGIERVDAPRGSIGVSLTFVTVFWSASAKVSAIS